MAVALKSRTATAYEWVAGSRFPVSADVVGATIERIKKRDGLCTPQAYVDASRDSKSPTHATLPWDDADAAEAYRRQVSRQIIRSVRPVGGPVAGAPAFFHVRVTDAEDVDEGYASLAEVEGRADYRAFVLQEARSRLAAIRRSYGLLKELDRVWNAIDEDAEEAAA